MLSLGAAPRDSSKYLQPIGNKVKLCMWANHWIGDFISNFHWQRSGIQWPRWKDPNCRLLASLSSSLCVAKLVRRRNSNQCVLKVSRLQALMCHACVLFDLTHPEVVEEVGWSTPWPDSLTHTHRHSIWVKCQIVKISTKLVQLTQEKLVSCASYLVQARTTYIC